jgi:hypothetical protein
MRVIARSAVVRRSIAFALSVSLAAIPVLAAGPSPAGPVSAATVSIASDPAGATVFVDGRASGVTPLSLDTLAPGDHRIRLTKDGFLENTRLIHVVKRQSSSVRVTLTRRAVATDAASQTAAGGGSTSSTNFLHNPIFLAGFTAVGAGAAVALIKNNVAPLPGTFSVSPETTGSSAVGGIGGVTEFVFAATGAIDYDDDPLTYTWNFGDGVSATGATVRHTYQGSSLPGGAPASITSFTTTLTVGDGEHEVSAGSKLVVVRPPLTGTWANAIDPIFSCPFTVSLLQTGRTLTGSILFSGGCTGSAVVQTGSLSGQTYPTTVTWQTGVFSLTYAGTVQTGLSLSFSGQSNLQGTTLSGPLVETQSGVPSPSAGTNFIKQ